MNEERHKALSGANLARAMDLLAAGADINGDICDATERRAVVRFMLENGADPRIITPDGSGSLFAAVIAQDTEVLRLLLDHGADPNREHDDSLPLYSYAEFDGLITYAKKHKPKILHARLRC